MLGFLRGRLLVLFYVVFVVWGLRFLGLFGFVYSVGFFDLVLLGVVGIKRWGGDVFEGVSLVSCFVF